MLTKYNLNILFDTAIKEQCDFIFIKISAEGIIEVIAIPTESFEGKQKFYNKAYTDELVHSMNSNVRIIDFTSGDVHAINELI